MSEYTPTTEDVRKHYSLGAYEFSPGDGKQHPDEYLPGFDWWLAAHEAKVKREGHREGYDAARQNMASGAFVGGPTYEAVRDSFTGRRIAAEAQTHARKTANTIIQADPRRTEAEVKAEAESLAPFAPKFWSRVNVGSPSVCWTWLGPTDAWGYGRFDSPVGTLAHRYAWAQANVVIPDAETVVRHKCDVPLCVNPAHLEPGTQRDNVADMIDRGRATYTHDACRNGHPRTPENTIRRKDGARRCRVCELDSQRSRRRARAAAIEAGETR